VKKYQMYLKESQLEKLAALSKKTEEPVSRLVRDAIDAYLSSKE